MKLVIASCLVAGALSGVATRVYSEELAETDILLDEITVTASSQPVNLRNTGATVDIVETAEGIAPSLTFSGLLNKAAGLNVSANGGLGTEASIRLRGLPSYYTGTRIDGINVADPSRPQLSFNFGTMMASGVARVEILKGSQSALYGSEAVAGIIDITSWRPDQNGTSGQIGAEFGSHGTFSGNISAGVKSDTSEIVFSFGRTKTDGISSRNNNSETDGYDGTQANFYASHKLSESISIGLSAISQESHTEYDESTTSADGWTEADSTGFRLFTEVNSGVFSHVLSASQFTTDRQDYQFSTDTFYKGNRNIVEYNGIFNATDDLSIGVFLENKVEDFTTESIYGNELGTVTTNAFGAEILLSANDETDVSLSLRRDDHSLFGKQDSGRFAASWRPNENWTLRGVAAFGYRSPSPYELWSVYGDENLKPEESRSFELGAEYSTDDVSLRATLFNTVIANQVIFEDLSYSYLQFEGDSTTRGLELSGDVYIANGWTAFATYTFTDATVLDDQGARRGVRTPRHQMAVGVEGSITARLSGSFSATQASDLWDETYIYDIDPSIPTVVLQERLPDYFTANMSFSYELTDAVRGYLRVENIFDEEYETIKGFSQPGRSLYVGVQSTF